MAVNNPYIWGTGRRKTATARVRIKPGTGKLVINDRGLILFRPVTVDMWGGNVALGGGSAGGFMAFWDIMFGGGVTF